MKWTAVTESMPEPKGQFYLVIVNTEHGGFVIMIGLTDFAD